jgi:hypothetical protein
MRLGKLQQQLQQHIVKVVRHEVTPPSSWKIDPVVSYGYTAHTNKVQKEGEVPTVRINYDILPVVVQYGEKKSSFYTFVTRFLGVWGGGGLCVCFCVCVAKRRAPFTPSSPGLYVCVSLSV